VQNGNTIDKELLPKRCGAIVDLQNPQTAAGQIKHMPTAEERREEGERMRKADPANRRRRKKAYRKE
jgi:hypothetical protein